MMCKSKSLFKYYPWDPKYDEFRLNGGLFFSSPRQFNDSLDCNLPIDNNWKEIGDIALHCKIKELYGDNNEQICNDIKAGRYEVIKQVYIEQQEKLGLLCLGQEACNPILWAHYAKNDGFCIEYQYDKLLSEIKNQFPKIMQSVQSGWKADSRVIGEEVEYVRTLEVKPKLFFEEPRSDYKEKYWTKLSQWSPEGEYRIGVSLGGNKSINTTGCIRRIIIGPNPTIDRYIRVLSLFKGDSKSIYAITTEKGTFEEHTASDFFKEEIKKLALNL